MTLLRGELDITKAELASVMGGIELDDDQWKKLVEECDENKDGVVIELLSI